MHEVHNAPANFHSLCIKAPCGRLSTQTSMPPNHSLEPTRPARVPLIAFLHLTRGPTCWIVSPEAGSPGLCRHGWAGPGVTGEGPGRGTSAARVRGQLWPGGSARDRRAFHPARPQDASPSLLRKSERGWQLGLPRAKNAGHANREIC